MWVWEGITRPLQVNLHRSKTKGTARHAYDKSIRTLDTVSIANIIINKSSLPDNNLWCHLQRKHVKSADLNFTLTPNTALDVNPSAINARLRRSTRRMSYAWRARTKSREKRRERVFRWCRSNNKCNRVGEFLVTLNPEMQEDWPLIISQLRSRVSVRLVVKRASLRHWIVTYSVKCATNATAWSILLISFSQSKAPILDRSR